jgi:hypothetical protein
LATDGEQVRRIRSLPEYIAFQEVHASDVAQAIIDEVQRGPNQPAGLQGYSSVEGESMVAMFRTDAGDDGEPAWAAFGDEQLSDRSLMMPTLPESVRNAPSLRLVGGASMAWRDRWWEVQAALEQKGETFLRQRRALNMIDHMSDWTLRGTVGTHDDHDVLDLVNRERPATRSVRVGPHRIETAFALDHAVYEAHADASGWQVWFTVQFDASLLCVPSAWRTFWMTVDIERPVQQ